MNISTVMGGIALVVWVAFVVILVFVALSASRNQPIRKGGVIVFAALAIAILISAVSSGVVFINASERGIVISAIAPKGYRETALDPGLHWIIPFLESVKTYSVAKQTYTMSISTGEGQVQGDDSITGRTSDGQEVFIDASVIFEIDPTKVVDLHLTWQDRYTDELVRPLARGIIRDVISQFTVAEVYSTKRVDLVSQINTQLAAKLSDNGLLLEDFILRNITFSKEFSASIEQKQIAEQQAQQAKLVVEQKKQEAEQARQTAQGQADAAVIAAKGDAQSRLISAEAEAKSLNMIAEVLKGNPNLLTYQYINKLSPSIQTMLVPSNSPYLLPLPNTTQSSTSSVSPTATPTTIPTTTP
jgi:regulator of protease activity HflC (stomatin/prohibitin superfamily)